MPSVPSSRVRWQARLRLEELEPRCLPAGYQPTAVEQLFLERLNDARANPPAYGTSIGLDLSTVAPSQPLAFDTRLIQAAHDHSQDMNDRGYFGHITPEGIDPGQRLTNAGFTWTSWGESIAAGYPTAEEALKGLIIDTGVPSLGHRRHLLAIDTIFQNQRQVGIGIVQNGTGPYGEYYTIDSAASSDTRPILTGVAFNDSNQNGKYDVGEGLSGVTITVAGLGSVTTFGSGGYSFPLNPGTYTVTASGAGLGTVTRTVTVGASNYRLNFTPSTSSPNGRFDFGTASSPLAAGYTQVTPATTYSVARGYGWQSGIILAVDRGTGADLTRDLNYGTSGTFAVDLANGTYTVTLTVGDLGHLHDQMQISLEGAVVDTLSTAAGQVLTKSYTVTVSDGQLTLRLQDLGGSDPNFVLLGLQVA